jgi:hypothetical protein
MITAQISQPQWVKLPPYVRSRIAQLFNLTRSQGSFVQDNELKSDGYTQTDLQGITLEGLQAHFKENNNDLYELFNRLVEEIEDQNTSNELDAVKNSELPIKWAKQINDIRSEAIETNLLEEFNNLINLLVPHIAVLTADTKNETTKTNKETKNKGTTKRGK